jgi:cellulose synthase/poly-beta-1,6-N-acetylglucosamine synthase-like glycosyltransferase
MVISILHILFEILFIYCALSVFYLLVLSVTGKFFYRKIYEGISENPSRKVAILVPAYKEDNIIVSTATSLLRIDYPADLYDIYIIADSFQPATLQQLRSLPIRVVEVSFTKSTKTKSLNEAFAQITRQYDIALICDADNVIARDFLKRLDYAFSRGARAVQGRRVAKNLDTSFAILDACSEAINNNIFRKGANAIGLSSAVIGSGMAFEYDHIKKIMSETHAVGGFDKIVQLKVVEQHINIRYLEGALVFDEKVDSSQAFRQQRKRWVSSQFIYLRQYFKPAVKQLLRGNFSYANLAIANNIVLPRAFMLVLLPVLVLFGFLLTSSWGVASIWLLAAYLLSLAVALPGILVNRHLFIAILRLPKAIGVMILALFQIKKANKTFIHTVHTKTEVSNTLFNDHGN